MVHKFNESWSFSIEDYAIEHQGNAVIDITVSYNYVDGVGQNDPLEYPEFTQIYNFINSYLINYSNETGFWEILNKNLVDTLLNKPIPTEFGVEYNLNEVVESLTVVIDVEPGSSEIEISRSSTVTGIPQSQQPAAFLFNLADPWSGAVMLAGISLGGMVLLLGLRRLIARAFCD